MTRWMTLGLLFLSVQTGCSGCGSSAPEGLVEYVPESALGVVVINSAAAVAELRALTPFDEFTGRWDDMNEAIDEYLEDQIGIGLMGAERAVIWVGDESWGAFVEGDFDGAVSGDTTEVAGVTVVEFGDGALMGVHDGDLLVGNEEGIEGMMDILEDDGTSLSDSDRGSAESLVDILGAVGGETFAVAFIADELDLDIPMPPVEVVGVGSSSDVLVARARLADDDEAEEAADQLNALVELGVGEMTREMDQIMEADDLTSFVVIGTIVASHAAELFAEELLEIDSDGTDVVLRLELPGMGATLPIIGMGAAIAIPAFVKYTRRSRTTEATMNVRRLFDSSVSYFDNDHATSSGEILPHQFPASVPLTPPEVPCGDNPYQSDYRDWGQETWEDLNFAVSDPQHYSYQYDSSGTREGATFTASAFGDLDCDGVYSTFVREGYVGPGLEIRGGAGLYHHNELE